MMEGLPDGGTRLITFIMAGELLFRKQYSCQFCAIFPCKCKFKELILTAGIQEGFLKHSFVCLFQINSLFTPSIISLPFADVILPAALLHL